MNKESLKEGIKNLRSYLAAQQPDKVRICPTCGLECKTGQLLWNGWYTYEEVYHYGCMPEKYKKSL